MFLELFPVDNVKAIRDVRWRATGFTGQVLGKPVYYLPPPQIRERYGTGKKDQEPAGSATRPMKRIVPVSLSWIRNTNG